MVASEWGSTLPQLLLCPRGKWACENGRGGGQKHFKKPAAQMVLQDMTSLIPQLLSKCRGQWREVFHPIYRWSMVKAGRCSSQGAPWKSPHHSDSASGSNSKRWGKCLFSKTPFKNNSKLFMHKEQRADAGQEHMHGMHRNAETYPVPSAPISTHPQLSSSLKAGEGRLWTPLVVSAFSLTAKSFM